MPEAGLRERKKAATRHALHRAALRLAVERGPERVTVDDIAEAADVSVRTFFNYFACKDDAFIGFDPDLAREAVESLAARPAKEAPLDAMRAVVTAGLHRYTDEVDEWTARAALLREHPHLRARHMAQFEAVERRLVEVLADRIGTDPDADVYPSLVVGAAVVALQAALRSWRAPESDAALPDVVATAFDHLARGLRRPASR